MSMEKPKSNGSRPPQSASRKRACGLSEICAYQKVAYIGLRNPDGSYLINVPLYVRVTELNKNGITDMQEELIHRISEKMMRRYEKQIGEFLTLSKPKTT